MWATKQRAPLIAVEAEEQVYQLLRQKALDLDAIVYAINGMPDHVHLVAAIPPKIAVAHFVGQIKAVTATKFNRTTGEQPHLVWQAEYGAFSFDGKRLPNYVGYVERQKEHHQAKQMIPILERMDDSGPLVLHEPTATYMNTDTDTEWWRELANMTY